LIIKSLCYSGWAVALNYLDIFRDFLLKNPQKSGIYATFGVKLKNWHYEIFLCFFQSFVFGNF
jgi:hypothetical protein